MHRGDIPNGLVINHKNGRKSDNRLENLEVVTYSENIKHAFRCLSAPVLRGSRNGNAKLTESEVVDIREARASGAQLGPLAREFGVSFGTISDICKGEKWRHVVGAPLALEDGRLKLSQPKESVGGRFVRKDGTTPPVDPRELSRTSYLTKLTEAQVLRIRSLAASGERLNRIATMFNVGPPCISKIVLRQTWTRI